MVGNSSILNSSNMLPAKLSRRGEIRASTGAQRRCRKPSIGHDEKSFSVLCYISAKTAIQEETALMRPQQLDTLGLEHRHREDLIG